MTDLAKKLDQLEAEAREEDEAERRQRETEKGEITNIYTEASKNDKAAHQITTNKHDHSKQRYPLSNTSFDRKFNRNVYACKHGLDTSSDRVEEIKDNSESPEELSQKNMFSDSHSMPFTSTPGTRINFPCLLVAKNCSLA